jgi:hypothetical protein
VNTHPTTSRHPPDDDGVEWLLYCYQTAPDLPLGAREITPDRGILCSWPVATQDDFLEHRSILLTDHCGPSSRFG